MKIGNANIERGWGRGELERKMKERKKKGGGNKERNFKGKL